MAVPRDRAADSTVALLREGYMFIPRRCRALGSDIFETRLMLTKAVCISGRQAAQQFYRPDQITRRGGLPQLAFTLIQDNGSVMALDGERHRVRKAMFLSLMGEDAMQRLAGLTEIHLRARAAAWRNAARVVLLQEVEQAFCACMAEWAGVELDAAALSQLARDCAALVDGTGSVGWRNVAGHLARGRVERQFRALIRRVRAGTVTPPPGSVLAVVAAHEDAAGARLDAAVAAVELINFIRAGIADARYVAFAVLALHDDPKLAEEMRDADEDFLDAFACEVRRFYPFIPFIGGRVLASFTWRGHAFRPGDWVLMDLYGTNHEARDWEDPDSFRPRRFLGHAPDAFAFVPSGGGEHARGHRCPGEWITQTHIKSAIRVMTRDLRYRLPPQDLRIDLARMPALPQSRVVLSDVRMAAF